MAGMWLAAPRLHLLWVAVLAACGPAAADSNVNGGSGAFAAEEALLQPGSSRLQHHAGLAMASTLFDPTASVDFSDDGMSAHGRSLLKVCFKGKKIKQKCVPAYR